MTTIFPCMKRKLKIMGENIKLARLRRKYTEEMVCERAGVDHEILSQIESGCIKVSLESLLCVLHVLNLDSDIYDIASDDPLGRKLQDIELLSNK